MSKIWKIMLVSRENLRQMLDVEFFTKFLRKKTLCHRIEKIQNRSEMLLLLAIPSEKLTYFSEV